MSLHTLKGYISVFAGPRVWDSGDRMLSGLREESCTRSVPAGLGRNEQHLPRPHRRKAGRCAVARAGQNIYAAHIVTLRDEVDDIHAAGPQMLTVPDMGTSRPYEVQIMDAYNQNIMVIGAPFFSMLPPSIPCC